MMCTDTLYQKYGFYTIPKALEEIQLNELKTTCNGFHQKWCQENYHFYQTRAVNSAGLTSSSLLNEQEIMQIFRLIASYGMRDWLSHTGLSKLAFMNSQLFFNPVNAEQKNYWHRDPQYHLNIEQQRLALSGPDVIHVRIALADENGIELIPGTHQRWDTKEELAVRLEQEGCASSDDLSGSKIVPLAAGDVLIFSANMIHRGLYGKDRLALDILFCEASSTFAGFINQGYLPNKAKLENFEAPDVFINSWTLSEQAK